MNVIGDDFAFAIYRNTVKKSLAQCWIRIGKEKFIIIFNHVMASPTAGRLSMETAVPGVKNDCLAQKSTMPDGRNLVRWIGMGNINPKLIGSGFRIQHRLWLQASSLIEEETFTPM